MLVVVFPSCDGGGSEAEGAVLSPTGIGRKSDATAGTPSTLLTPLGGERISVSDMTTRFRRGSARRCRGADLVQMLASMLQCAFGLSSHHIG
eukprot:scaffold51942_cov31-Attheya_sp.AAC.3